ncbi:hypothetical protein Pme01_52060 [Planosporangium mesophilum]|uniref:Pentapeptide repeat-containing protein n=1 Tax=Planosporangium mesophilum TaxID=689768 RepID=A0A8J3X3L8_9ACTN|nr:hypothetical protein Pme01_52060 [Planosporangium mesophilum]
MPVRWRVAYFVGVAILLVFLASRSLTSGSPSDHGRSCPHATDLSGRAVAGVDLSQQQLPCLNLERSTLSGSIQESDLSRANLHRAQLQTLWLNHVNLSGSDLTDAVGESANLTGVKLEGADLRRANLRGARLEDVGLQRSKLGAANLRAAGFTRSDLGGADVRGAELAGASFYDSNLRGARLDRAKLKSVVWSNVVCPDGTKSTADEQGTCDRHLTPAR